MIPATNNLTTKQIAEALKPVIRRIVKEEIKSAAEKKANIFILNPDMLLYKDMSEIKNRKKNKKLRFYTPEEVWGNGI